MVAGAPASVAKGEMRVDVGLPLYVSVAGGWSDRGKNFECAAMGSFVAQEGAQHELLGSVGQIRRQCVLLLLQTASTAEIIRRGPMVNWLNCPARLSGGR